MENGDRGWHKVFEFMISGDPASFVIWAIVGFAIWSAIFEGPYARSRGEFLGNGDSDSDGGGDAD